MNINRHNYEEFFLMYVDNELSLAERAEVEAFVEQNQDLKSELELFKDAVMMPDENSQAVDKSKLYKNEHSINLENYEEYFLLYVDNELQDREKDEVEKFVLQNPALQHEFTLLQQSKLKPELIVFKNKEQLYKSEGKVRRLVPIVWMRIASAAVFIGIVALLWMVNGDEKATMAPIASFSPEREITPQKAPGVTYTEIEKQPAPIEKSLKQEVVIAKKKVMQPQQVEVIQNVAGRHNKITSDDGNLNQIPSSENNPVIASNQKRDKGSSAPIENVTEKFGEISSPSGADYANNNSSHSNASITKHAVYREVDGDDEKTIFIAGAEINKNKLRGLFKKATTLLEKRFKKTEGNTDDGESNIIQVAGFEIKTK